MPTICGLQPTTACDGLAAVARHAWAVEEPVAARDWPALAEIGARTGLAIILDESVTRLEDLGQLVPGPRYVLNARVSKHGGLLRTLAVIEAARAAGLGIIVGAQVGETSILARAGLVAAKAAGADLIAYRRRLRNQAAGPRCHHALSRLRLWRSRHSQRSRPAWRRLGGDGGGGASLRLNGVAACPDQRLARDPRRW